MKTSYKILNIVFIALFIAVIAMPIAANSIVPNSQTATNTTAASSAYRVGYSQGDTQDGWEPVYNAFNGAYSALGSGYNPTNHVTNTDGWYSQTYNNASGRNASVYVDGDNNAYTVGYPLYDQWDGVGGLEATGYPSANAYNVNGSYYQNFTNGYMKYADNNAQFVKAKSVNETGVESDLDMSDSGMQNGMSDTQNGTGSDIGDTGDAAGYGNTDNNNTTGDVNANQLSANGIGADSSGVAGSLSSANSVNPIAAVIGLVVLAAVIILVVSISASMAKSR